MTTSDQLGSTALVTGAIGRFGPGLTPGQVVDLMAWRDRPAGAYPPSQAGPTPRRRLRP